ncbi:hypothetical protein CCR75_006346 [Bremia lactucae]|uniref:Autophagy-related protein 17 n=1 Tax=Bremia lactucae TaxID=4779 RepID=A0A976ILW6_BRELC|nr:hypothetical protein CCR75_006346 [Bremia lactucae]
MDAEYFTVATREITKTISEKCQVLDKMLEASRVKLHSAQKIAQDSVFPQMPLLHEMNHVFKQLQGTIVDPSLVGEEQGKTLFDFIDAETVRSLQQDAVEQVKEVEELLATHQHAITRIAAIHEFFVALEKMHEQKMDALNGDLREPSSMNTSSYEFVACHCSCMQTNVPFGSYEVLFADLRFLFDELLSLRDFYRHFLASYSSIGPELQRRKQVDANIYQFIKEIQAKLTASEQEEIALRSTFCAEHNAPDKFTIVRENIPTSEVER